MKRWAMIGGAVFLLLGIAAAGGLYATGRLDGLLARPVATAAAVPAEKSAPDPDLFYDLPEIQVTLPGPQRDEVVRLDVSIECPDQENLALLRGYVPRALDAVQVYVRSLTLVDFRGRANLEKLRRGLIAQIDSALAPGRISNLLFRQMLVE